MNSPDYSISTPENVDLHLELAGVGNRALACLIDTIVSYAVCVAIWLAVWLGTILIGMANLPVKASALACGIVLLIGMLASFIVIFFYYVIFEGFWQGQTPGKRVAQIRVIDQNGQMINWSQVWLRNFIRVFDMGLMLIGMIVMVIDKNERRIGDFAAGSLVIKESTPTLLSQNIAISPAAKEGLSSIDAGRITPQEYDLLLNFLRRREKMALSQRPLLARELENHFRDKLNQPSAGNKNAEVYLESLYCAYQSRAE